MSFNNRIIIIDDQKEIHELYREILIPKNDNKIDEITAFLKDTNNSNNHLPVFEIDSAFSGKEGVEKVEKSIRKGTPYALAFIDMRMPPGWNGMETAKRIRKIDKNIEIVIVTAYTDISREEIAEKIGAPEKLLYLKKPFTTDEIQQLAINLTEKYSLWENNNFYTNKLHTIIEQQKNININLNDEGEVIKSILKYLMTVMHASTAGIISESSDEIELLFAIGKNISHKHIEKINKAVIAKEKTATKDFFLFPLEYKKADSQQRWIFSINNGDKEIENKEIILLIQNIINNFYKTYKLEQEEKQHLYLSSIGMAVNKIIHDLKTPLSVISAYTDLLTMKLKKIKIDKETRKQLELYLTKIKRTESEIKSLIFEVLDYSKNKVQIKKAPILIHEFMENIKIDFSPLFKENNITFSYEFDDDIFITIDAAKMTRAIANIISNAFQAFEEHNVKNPIIKIRAEKREKKLYTISIYNNAPEIPISIRKTLFHPFVSEGTHKGTGLGLAITKQIIEAHNGTIDFVTNESGTTFFIKLPL